MKTILAAVALAAPLGVAAQPASSQPAESHQARLYQRYCEKLRDGPEAYAQFVNRMRLVTGFAATDFASRDGAAPSIAACRENGQRLAVASQAEPSAKRR